jgi:hypothetical protein
MKRTIFASLVFALVAAQMVFAHDPRTVSKDFSHVLTLEGAGKLTLSYKSLHYNEAGFAARKERLAPYNRVWGAIGKLDTEFDVVIAGVKVPKGSYGLGVNFDANDNFKLVLKGGAGEIAIPLQVAMDSPQVNYLSFDLRPENATDTFTLEARYGKMRVSAETKVPFLGEHDHGGHQHDAPPAAKKPEEKKP